MTDELIKEACRNGKILIDPFEDRQVQPATYDLRIGSQGATLTGKKLVDIEREGYLVLEGGDFGIIVTLEELRLDTQHAARFGLRSKYARRGLLATTGPQVDPGYHGRIILGLSNLTPDPISLPFKDDIISVEFHRLNQPASRPYRGPYQDKLELRPEDIGFIVERQGVALPEVIKTLSALSADVRGLTDSVKILHGSIANLQWTIPIVIAIGMAIIAIIVGLK